MYSLTDGDDAYQWGVVGNVPILSTLGALVRVQSAILHGGTWEQCPESALVIAWPLGASSPFNWYLHECVPVDTLVGMMELVKSVIINTHMARQAAAQQIVLASPGQSMPILGPDGFPVRH